MGYVTGLVGIALELPRNSIARLINKNVLIAIIANSITHTGPYKLDY
jgi:hypothetical protein